MIKECENKEEKAATIEQVIEVMVREKRIVKNFKELEKKVNAVALSPIKNYKIKEIAKKICGLKYWALKRYMVDKNLQDFKLLR